MLITLSTDERLNTSRATLLPARQHFGVTMADDGMVGLVVAYRPDGFSTPKTKPQEPLFSPVLT